MSQSSHGARKLPGVAGGRLPSQEYRENFSDLHAPLERREAMVESDRCYFCYDAPCMNACPTGIDIPMFIRQISTDNPVGSAKTIFDQNILGGMCARVCPTETLCEEVCVREIAEGKPVKIGELQRYATDIAMERGVQFYERAPSTGKRIAVVGAGPAGLACAHRLAVNGHSVEVFEAREKSGGLNEYGIAAYKSTDNFAQREVDYVTAIGGIEIRHGQVLGRDFDLAKLTNDYDSVFLSIGLGSVNALGDLDVDATGNDDAVEWISHLRQAKDLASVPVGRRVVVIGGGMTAIDAGVQAKALGAEEVTICYRGPQSRMKASAYEQELAQTRSVVLRFDMQPQKIVANNGVLQAVHFDNHGETIEIECDQLFKAIGQSFEANRVAGLTLDGGRIAVDDTGRTSMAKVWAGGDCTNSGEDLTVAAVAQGRDAGEHIHAMLSGNAGEGK